MQYVLSYKNKNSLFNFLTRLKNDGYSLHHGLDDCYKITERIIGICVDFENKTVFQLNVTCMACWCDNKRKPLYVEEINDNYERLISNKDYSFYNELVEKHSKDRNRSSGMILKLD